LTALKSSFLGEVLVIYFAETSYMDEARISIVGKDLKEMVGKAHAGKCLLDLSGVNFMSSAMISELIHFDKKCKADEIILKICGLTEKVQEAFKVMRLNKLFDIYKDERLAIASYNKKKGWFS